MIINDLIPGVIRKLRGRDDQTPNIPDAAKKAILDLTENYEFEELKVSGPMSNFVVGQQEYPLRGYDPLGIQGNPFIASSDVALTFITSWFVFYDPSGVVVPTLGVSSTLLNSNNGMEMKARSIRVVEPMSKIPGIPTIYCIHGEKINGLIIVGFMPNAPYACQMRYQRQHPFPPDSVTTNSSTGWQILAQQKVYMPIDWQDIIEYATAEKLCDEIGMNDVGLKYHQKLFGYKDKYGNETPGLVQVRQSQQQRMESYNERRLIPVCRRYT